MKKPFVFVSCGQYTDSEKALGKEIVRIVRAITGLEAFFAEEVQDLNGLQTNILEALRDCFGLITVMHPRGKIVRPEGPTQIRASVWIEQEIAIAAYIQQTRRLPVIAFEHKDIGREGIRELLHLNPVKFTNDSEVLDALTKRLQPWKALSRAETVHVELKCKDAYQQSGHQVRYLRVDLVNNSTERITKFDGELRVLEEVLKNRHA